MQVRKKSEADWALEILAERKEPIFYSELTQLIAQRMGRPADVPTLTSIYTRINLDNRLIYQGDGYWYFDASKIYREV
ncbi:MAG: DNA-directed RNA polymerase subunit delta [Syntrophomonadaceae bacterium]|nr:DNA-directed RNA polymerase subunit delta [Syntrophomonadaceae bacterium]